MAIARRFAIPHDEVFPHGAYVVGEVAPVIDFNRSTREQKIQQVDEESGLLIWSVDVLDADPQVKRASKTVSVKMLAKVQPVPPAPSGGLPFALVEFTGLSALPYIDENGQRPRLAWSFRADGMQAPSTRKSGASTSSGDGSAKAA